MAFSKGRGYRPRDTRQSCWSKTLFVFTPLTPGVTRIESAEAVTSHQAWPWPRGIMVTRLSSLRHDQPESVWIHMLRWPVASLTAFRSRHTATCRCLSTPVTLPFSEGVSRMLTPFLRITWKALRYMIWAMKFSVRPSTLRAAQDQPLPCRIHVVCVPLPSFTCCVWWPMMICPGWRMVLVRCEPSPGVVRTEMGSFEMTSYILYSQSGTMVC
mmetsp:Transcript_36451/g.67342  ORF Transcript_36451/g.67342 Transcript_36451/m.67342 type:complete len:213 (-) Transcript_36451:734-1372(-)